MTKVVASIATMAYTKFPPKTLYCLDTANKEVIDAGPSARAMDVKLWLRPFTEPRDCLLGAALVIDIEMAATHTGEIDPLKDQVNVRNARSMRTMDKSCITIRTQIMGPTLPCTVTTALMIGKRRVRG